MNCTLIRKLKERKQQDEHSKSKNQM